MVCLRTSCEISDARVVFGIGQVILVVISSVVIDSWVRILGQSKVSPLLPLISNYRSTRVDIGKYRVSNNNMTSIVVKFNEAIEGVKEVIKFAVMNS